MFAGEINRNGDIKILLITLIFKHSLYSFIALYYSGHDTTASAISWILYDLAKHPEHQTLCREEVEQVLQGREDEEFVW